MFECLAIGVPNKMMELNGLEPLKIPAPKSIRDLVSVEYAVRYADAADKVDQRIAKDSSLLKVDIGVKASQRLTEEGGLRESRSALAKALRPLTAVTEVTTFPASPIPNTLLHYERRAETQGERRTRFNKMITTMGESIADTVVEIACYR